jgi:acetyltransferase-like isoleucine patch superfamily enzyme
LERPSRRVRHALAVAVAPPSASPRVPGLRDRLRAWRAGPRVLLEGPAAIGPGVRFDVSPGARVVVGAGASLAAGCRFHVRGGEVRIGAGAILGDRCVIVAHERVEVGPRCVLGDEVVLVDADHVFGDPERPVRLQGVTSSPVVLGTGVRVGPGAAVLRGVTVGDGAVVGANAVVTADVAAGAVVSGVPARVPPRAGARPARGGAAPR